MSEEILILIIGIMIGSLWTCGVIFIIVSLVSYGFINKGGERRKNRMEQTTEVVGFALGSCFIIIGTFMVFVELHYLVSSF